MNIDGGNNDLPLDDVRLEAQWAFQSERGDAGHFESALSAAPESARMDAGREFAFLLKGTIIDRRIRASCRSWLFRDM